MPFDSMTGPDLTQRLTWLWNHRATLTAAEWQEFYTRVVHDIFGRYRFGELGGLLEHFEHDRLCHDCFQEKIWAGDHADQRDETYKSFYTRTFHNYLVDVFRRHQEEINNTESYTDRDEPAETDETTDDLTTSGASLADPLAPPLRLIDAEFRALLQASARVFVDALDDVDRILLKCWFAADGTVPLVRFKAVIGARYNSRAVRLGIKVQEADETYADYGHTLLGKLWARVCKDWGEKHPGRYVPEDGIVELVSMVQREALQLAKPDCGAVLGMADGLEQVT